MAGVVCHQVVVINDSGIIERRAVISIQLRGERCGILIIPEDRLELTYLYSA